MGYTHYWQRPKELDKETFNECLEDFRKLLPLIEIEIGGHLAGWDGEGLPELTPEVISFNGVRSRRDGCETFRIARISEDKHWGVIPAKNGEVMLRNGCKTARTPYDLAVCCCLIIFKHHFEDNFILTSDGDPDGAEWRYPREFCLRFLGYELDFGDDPQVTR